MESVLVVGAGFMGTGIAQVCAQAGYKVHLVDSQPQALQNAMREIKWSAGKLHSKGLIKDNADTVAARVSPESTLDSAKSVNWVIEAIFEDVELKKKLFKELDGLAPADTPLATNSSSIPISILAKATRHPERVLGIHFFGPVPMMAAVEVIRGEKTSEAVFERGVAFVKSINHVPVRVNKDIPGFILNRIWGAALGEAMELLEKGIATVEDIDLGMKLGFGWRVGPFEIADNAGLDTQSRVTKTMKELEPDLITISPMLEKMIGDGRLGKKVGRGFYNYTADGKRVSYDVKKEYGANK